MEKPLIDQVTRKDLELFLEKLPEIIKAGKELVLPAYMAYSGFNAFEKVTPGSGGHGALAGVILERLSHTMLAASEVAGTAIAAGMAAIGVTGMPGVETIVPGRTTTVEGQEIFLPEIPGTLNISAIFSLFGL